MKHRKVSAQLPAPRRGAQGARASLAGFTLIEMLIVMVILGLVVAFAAPKIDMTKFRVESSMQGIGMTMLAAERQAITQQHDVILLFDVPNNVIRIHDDANNNGVMDAGERVRGVPLGDGIVFGRATAPARPMGAGPVTFTKVLQWVPRPGVPSGRQRERGRRFLPHLDPGGDVGCAPRGHALHRARARDRPRLLVQVRHFRVEEGVLT